MRAHLDKNKVYYLASPYSGKTSNKVWNKLIEQERYEEVTELAAKLVEKFGVPLILPITMSHELRKAAPSLKGSWRHWQHIDTHFIRVSDVLLVALFDGWEESVGVQAEIDLAHKMNKPVLFMNPVTLDIYDLSGVKVLKDLKYNAK